MIVYRENPKDSIRKLLKVISEFGKVTGSHRNHLHLYILTKKNQKEKLRTQFHLPLQQKIKYLGINLPKETKNSTQKIIRH